MTDGRQRRGGHILYTACPISLTLLTLGEVLAVLGRVGVEMQRSKEKSLFSQLKVLAKGSVSGLSINR
jgi:hypothetical protein